MKEVEALSSCGRKDVPRVLVLLFRLDEASARAGRSPGSTSQSDASTRRRFFLYETPQSKPFQHLYHPTE